MRHGRSRTATRHRTAADEEGSLIDVDFLGSFPTADFTVTPALPEIAFVGRSNVGKSSLINAVLERRSVAHTSKTPGKTRYLNVFRVDSLFNLVDFPGYGFARVSKKERAGFNKLYHDYLTNRSLLAGIIWLLDIRHDPSKDDLSMGGLIAGAGVPVLAAITKADKVAPRLQADRVASVLDKLGLPEDQHILTSSPKKTGISDLRESIWAFLDEL